MDYDGMPFCGTPTVFGASASNCKWNTNKITWTVTGYVPGLSPEQIIDAYKTAFSYWEEVCNIHATYTTDPSQAMVVMGAGKIDGPNGTLAWSEMPCGNARKLNQKYDTGESWCVSEQPSSCLDLVRVACHEIGHALGIQHISNGNLLAPTYSNRIRRPQLGDIAEAQARYGKPQPLPQPPDDSGPPEVPDDPTDPTPTPVPVPVPGFDWWGLIKKILEALIKAWVNTKQKLIG